MDIQLFTPYPQQKEVIDACLNRKYFIVTAVAGRQSGKSFLSLNMAAYWALNESNQVIMWVSPTATQALKVMKQMVNDLANAGLIKGSKQSKGDAEITFNNGSVILFKSAMQKDALRGYTVNYMILDEAAFIQQDIFNEILLPMTNVAGRKILIITSPKGKNWIYQYYLKGLDASQKEFISFKFNSSDNPFAKKSIIEIARLNLPEELFKQEFLAEFVDSASVFRNVNELANLISLPIPSEGQNYYIGVDVGMLKDETVVTVLNQNGYMVYYDAFTGLEIDAIKDRILTTLRAFNPISASIEQNNQGLPLLQLIQKEWPNIEGFITTNESKQEIINQLIAAFSSKEIRVIDDDKIKLQLQSFIFKILSSGKIKYEAASGFHDDVVMSLAIAWNTYVKNKVGQRYPMISSNSVSEYKPSFGGTNQVVTNSYMIMGGSMAQDYEREY